MQFSIDHIEARGPVKGVTAQIISAFPGQGSQQAFAALYDQYSPALFGIVTRIVGNNLEAEDVLQKCFLEIWAARRTYNPSSESLLIWMIKIARNTAIEAIRAVKASNHAENHLFSDFVYSTGVESYLCGKISAPDIDKNTKEALKLIYFQCFNFTEAALRLKIPTDILILKLKLAINQLNG